MNKKLAMIALSIVAIVASIGVGLAIGYVTLPKHTVYLTVAEAITITPLEQEHFLYVGESVTANFEISNAADVEIPLELEAVVTGVPEGGDSSDVIIDCPPGITAQVDGVTALQVVITLKTGAITGNYTVEVVPTRV